MASNLMFVKQGHSAIGTNTKKNARKAEKVKLIGNHNCINVKLYEKYSR